MSSPSEGGTVQSGGPIPKVLVEGPLGVGRDWDPPFIVPKILLSEPTVSLHPNLGPNQWMIGTLELIQCVVGSKESEVSTLYLYYY